MTWIQKDRTNVYFVMQSIFSQKRHLKSHVDSIHKNIRFGCQDCEKQFTQKVNSTRHMKTVHKGIRYRCEQCECDKEFAHASSRYQHTKSVHEQKNLSREKK